MATKEDPDAIESAAEATNESVSSPTTSSWWSPWLEAAKSKSTEVLEFVKKDFTEISSAVKTEASAVVNSTAAVFKDTLNKLDDSESTAGSMKKSMSTFLESVTSVLNPAPDDEGEEAILVQNDAVVTLSRFQTRLFSLIKTQETFTEAIEDEVQPQFESWLSVADEQMTRERLTKLLMLSPDLHNMYELLVPAKVSHQEFWQRYLFRKALLEDEESLKEVKEKKEKALADRVQWEKENFNEDLNLTEEEQMKILADYEDEKRNPPLTEKLNTTSPSADLIAQEKPAHKDSKKTPKKSPAKKVVKEQASPEKNPTNELIMQEKRGMVVVEDSSRASVSTSSTESKDDWEKDFDLDDETIIPGK